MYAGGVCRGEVLPGYYNNSGQAELCGVVCRECAGTGTNCTACGGNLSLFNSTCVGACPAGTTSVANICTACLPPCLACSPAPSSCSSCAPPLLLHARTCLAPSQCPDHTYPNTNLSQCSPCLAPCLQCSSQ